MDRLCRFGVNGYRCTRANQSTNFSNIIAFMFYNIYVGAIRGALEQVSATGTYADSMHSDSLSARVYDRPKRLPRWTDIIIRWLKKSRCRVCIVDPTEQLAQSSMLVMSDSSSQFIRHHTRTYTYNVTVQHRTIRSVYRFGFPDVLRGESVHLKSL